ncbi:hypothetical protein Z043_123601 [Scleropages formosus]|uniref:PH domain-containing protein n=1 Tax=Scleropages formosus TaxID=113540 RepID=A0A0N8JVM6_SCLFO|nr:hypothetical protein Z043_123601 [Scleropages formosus]
MQKSKSMVMGELSRSSGRPSSPGPQEKVLKAGWLKKQRSIMKNWQLRWFVLRTDQLYFYKDEEETKPQVRASFHEALPLSPSHTLSLSPAPPTDPYQIIGGLCLFDPRYYTTCSTTGESVASWKWKLATPKLRAASISKPSRNEGWLMHIQEQNGHPQGTECPGINVNGIIPLQGSQVHELSATAEEPARHLLEIIPAPQKESFPPTIQPTFPLSAGAKEALALIPARAIRPPGRAGGWRNGGHSPAVGPRLQLREARDMGISCCTLREREESHIQGGNADKDRTAISHEAILLMANSQNEVDDWVKAIRRTSKL